ncbi:hypothetical protein IAD21_00671 [Abditibacteriota bacterium]|nr:hypothetical protein IAD21_00671 [Abditibacteriota bacterium]
MIRMDENQALKRLPIEPEASATGINNSLYPSLTLPAHPFFGPTQNLRLITHLREKLSRVCCRGCGFLGP